VAAVAAHSAAGPVNAETHTPDPKPVPGGAHGYQPNATRNRTIPLRKEVTTLSPGEPVEID